MKNFVTFTVAAVVVELVALLASRELAAQWVLLVLLGAFALFLVFVAVRGYRKQQRIDFPPSMNVRVVRKRHWHWFNG